MAKRRAGKKKDQNKALLLDAGDMQELDLVMDRLRVQCPGGDSLEHCLRSFRAALADRPLLVAALLERLSKEATPVTHQAYLALKDLVLGTPYERLLRQADYRFRQRGLEPPTGPGAGSRPRPLVLVPGGNQTARAAMIVGAHQEWSVAALVPRAEIEGEMGDAVMGAQARLMSQALRKLTAAISKSKAVVIFTNQLRHKIGVMFGNPETTPGGLALKFYSSVRIDLRKIGAIKEGEVVIGSRHRARVIKNKVAAPFREAEFDIMNVGGISLSGNILDMALEMLIVEKSGAFFKYNKTMLGQGREAAKVFLEKNPKVMKQIEDEIWKKQQTA